MTGMEQYIFIKMDKLEITFLRETLKNTRTHQHTIRTARKGSMADSFTLL